MINIIFRQENGLCIEAQGHAEFAKKDDIVCAAVSSLVGTLAYSVSHSPAFCGNISLENGYARIFTKDNSLLPYFEFTLTGLRLIGENYPENVKITLL